MIRPIGVSLAALAIAAAAPGHATELCGWVVETTDKEGFHEFSLFLQADGEAEIYYMMKGQGVTSEGMRSYSPGSGTYSLRRGQASKVWGFGSSVYPPADIDMIAEIHAPPASIFQDEEPPLLAAFTFKRHVPEDETIPPRTFAAKQCASLPPSKPR